MAITLADTYYLKALDMYPFDLDQVTEALNYAIGYDNEHAGAHCLLGILNMYDLGNFRKAEDHFEKALAGDINHTSTYYYFAKLLIKTGELVKAKKLIEHAYGINGVNIGRIKYNECIIAEIKGKLHNAKKYMKSAYALSYRKYEREYLKEELDRIKSKLKSKKKSSSK